MSGYCAEILHLTVWRYVLLPAAPGGGVFFAGADRKQKSIWSTGFF